MRAIVYAIDALAVPDSRCTTVFLSFSHPVYNAMIGTVLNSMFGHIGLPNIIQKIIQVSRGYKFNDLVVLVIECSAIHLYCLRIPPTSSKTSSNSFWEC